MKKVKGNQMTSFSFPFLQVHEKMLRDRTENSIKAVHSQMHPQVCLPQLLLTHTQTHTHTHTHSLTHSLTRLTYE